MRSEGKKPSKPQRIEAKPGNTVTADIPRTIEDHAVIGDLNTVALVARDGAIDFLCWPYFDSPTVFADLLDPDEGGIFHLSPNVRDARILQMYMPDTNVLLTRWLGDDASAELLDFMPVCDQKDDCSTRVVRRIRATRGNVVVSLRCAPRFDYARERVAGTLKDGCVWFEPAKGPPLRLLASVELELADGDVETTFTLCEGESADFVLDDGKEERLTPDELQEMELATIGYWQAWAAQSTYRGRWREAVMRSALALKLLTSQRYGSILAAATFGLPEARGGERNWDYRATWIRDASFTVYALMRLGYKEEALAFNGWLGDRAKEAGPDGTLSIMYSVDGGSNLEERSLDNMSGYGGARPVRIGNDAYRQKQLDIYGEMLDSMYLNNKYGHAISHDEWLGVTRVVNYVCDHWQEPDQGIWEMRAEPQEFLHSRLMCWVAVDRAVRLASKRSLAAPFERWIEVRNNIYEDIWTTFWNDDVGHFVQCKGSRMLDASLLLMPLVRFVSATDPRWLATLDAIGKELSDDGIIYRYSGPDGLTGEEGAFSACSFWYVECLARAGRTTEARFIFEKVLHYSNHVDLYAEEFDRRAGLMGNFPQAFTHLALISAAYYLDREIDGRNSQEWRP